MRPRVAGHERHLRSGKGSGKGRFTVKTLNDYINQQLEDPEFAEAWLEGEDEYQSWRALEHPQAEDEPVPLGLHEAV